MLLSYERSHESPAKTMNILVVIFIPFWESKHSLSSDNKPRMQKLHLQNSKWMQAPYTEALLKLHNSLKFSHRNERLLQTRPPCIPTNFIFDNNFFAVIHNLFFASNDKKVTVSLGCHFKELQIEFNNQEDNKINRFILSFIINKILKVNCRNLVVFPYLLN